MQQTGRCSGSRSPGAALRRPEGCSRTAARARAAAAGHYGAVTGMPHRLRVASSCNKLTPRTRATVSIATNLTAFPDPHLLSRAHLSLPSPALLLKMGNTTRKITAGIFISLQPYPEFGRPRAPSRKLAPCPVTRWQKGTIAHAACGGGRASHRAGDVLARLGEAHVAP